MDATIIAVAELSRYLEANNRITRRLNDGYTDRNFLSTVIYPMRVMKLAVLYFLSISSCDHLLKSWEFSCYYSSLSQAQVVLPCNHDFCAHDRNEVIVTGPWGLERNFGDLLKFNGIYSYQSIPLD